jgi:hypothetical protein
MSEILKGVTTSFAEPFKYHTVSKDRKGQECRIPERCVWWVAKVEGAGDDQVFNRMLTCWIDDSEEQDSRILSRTLADCESMPAARPVTRKEIEVCREMWKALGSAWVVVPFGTRIRISSAANRRNPDMLIDLIRAYAVLYQMQRRREVVDGMPVIFAERSDFDRAASLYERLNGEAALIKAIRETGYSEITVTQMQQATGWSNSSIYKLLHGYMSRGVTYSGLLEKCPAISFSDRTVVCDAEGATTHRRTRAYTWDEVLYDSWGKAGWSGLRRRSPVREVRWILMVMAATSAGFCRLRIFPAHKRTVIHLMNAFQKKIREIYLSERRRMKVQRRVRGMGCHCQCVPVCSKQGIMILDAVRFAYQIRKRTQNTRAAIPRHLQNWCRSSAIRFRSLMSGSGTSNGWMGLANEVPVISVTGSMCITPNG